MSNIVHESNNSDPEREECVRHQMALIPDITVLHDEESSGVEGDMDDGRSDSSEGSGVEEVAEEVVEAAVDTNGVMDDDHWDNGESDTSGDVQIDLGDTDTLDGSGYESDDDEMDGEVEVDELEDSDDEPEVVLAGFVRITRRYRQA